MQHPAIRVLSALAASAALAILGLAAAGGAAAAAPGTLYVSPSGSAANSDTSCTTARYSSIQQAVNAVRPADTVVACAGTYHEQVSIAVPHLTVPPPAGHPSRRGQERPACGGDRVRRPQDDRVTVSGLSVQGSMLNPFFATTCCADDFVGVWFDQSSGAVSHAAVTGIILPTGLLGCQDGLGILAHSPSGTSHVAVTRTSVSDYGKNGITCRDTGTICDISHDTVTGSGPDPFIAQNGVEIAFGAGGTVRGNTITGNECDDTAGGCGPDR